MVTDELMEELLLGEAGSAEYEAKGWASSANRSALWTVYRAGHPLALAPAVIDDLLAVTADYKVDRGYWRKLCNGPVPAARLTVQRAALAANAAWMHWPIDNFEGTCVHKYAVGSGFAAHVDASPSAPWRVINVIAMVQPATRGGRLLFERGYGPIDLDLKPGDVCCCDSSVLHEVTEIEEGERLTLVTHALRAAPWMIPGIRP